MGEKYLAHIDGEREQTLKEHLEGTAKLAGKFAKAFGNEDWGYTCGMLHDIGKYSNEFQKKIIENGNQRVDHSTAGAQLCREKGGLYGSLSWCIAGHHAGLTNFGNEKDPGSESTLCGRFNKKICDYHAYEKEIKIPELKTMPFDPRKAIDKQFFSLSVFIRMLYSCLVDADFLDTEYFMKNGKVDRVEGDNVEVLLERLEDHIKEWLKNEQVDTLNGRRTEILKSCLDAGKKEKGIFRLTVPTGGGKTIASLAFALRHAVKHHMNRVIYVIPYTSIIEQNAEIFRNILGEDNVLENHCNIDYESSEELKPMQLATENWDKPVVVTTNVQFFESLFANKSSKCRKLHNIANSVVIFDEVQMLPNDYLNPCVAMIEELVRNYGVSAVLCTATQPSLDPLFSDNVNIKELCPRVEEQFEFFKRVSFEKLGKIEEDELIERLSKEKYALCIVNKRKKAQTLYEKLKGEGVYHLSTTMYPEHRKRMLKEIKEKLSKEKRCNPENKCILIATSLVEAGVDFDFDFVYRELAGIDSIVQAAGRCNRERRKEKEESQVYIFQFDEKEGRLGLGQQQQKDATELVLGENDEPDDLKVIKNYFSTLYQIKGNGLDKKKIMDKFKNQAYDFIEVAKEFKLIEEKTISIFINQNEESNEILEDIKIKGFTKSGMRKAGKYCINAYESDFDTMQGAGMLRPISEDMEDFYELVKMDEYTENMGLNLNIDEGMGVFM